MQVDVTTSLAVPVRKHRGNPDEGIILRAASSFGKEAAQRYDAITVR